MPKFNTKIPEYKKNKDVIKEWPNFRKGLNLFSRETELGNDEMAQADNIVLVGKGVPTGRWGTSKYFSVNTTGSIRGLGRYTDVAADTYEILALSDEGYLCKKNGTGSSVIAGQSWPSGSKIQTEQLGGKVFIVSEDVSFTEYDGSSLVAFTTIPKPTGLTATNISGATGANRVSYKVVGVDVKGGTTEGSDNYVLENLPFNLSETRIDVSWTGISTASLSAYEIYRGTEGDERYVATVDPEIQTYSDLGETQSEILQVPIVNTTGGYKSKFIVKYKDRILLVPEGDPTRLVVSGRYPYHTDFSIGAGGTYGYIDPDGGEEISGLIVQPLDDSIIVYKEHSSYRVKLKQVSLTTTTLTELEYQPISTSIGCSSQEALATVQNDTFYFGRDGIYVTGYEPNFLNIIRTNEISARMRPELDKFNDDDYKNACAMYVDNKYILSIPTRKEMIVYDRERGSFAGVWKLPYGISYMRKYYESNGTERWILGSYDSNQVYTFEKSVYSDDGTTIAKTIKTNKEDFGDWTLLSLIKFFYILFADITGETNVSIKIENRDGDIINAKTFTISGSEVAGVSGYGVGTYAEYPYGLTDNNYSTSTNEITRWGTLFKQARLAQIEITSNANNSNFELLSIKLTAAKQAEGSLPSSQRV